MDLMGLKPNLYTNDPIFLRCVDTVGWVIWPVKSRPRSIWPIMCLVGC